MRKMKKPLAIVAVLCVAIATSMLATWLSMIIEDDPPGIETVAHRYEDAGRTIDWDSLPDAVIAWVEVPGTSIDEPIVQATEDSPNAYLHVDAMGQGAYGTPYVDWECSIDSRFVMIYGHHMSDGSTFADFASFIEKGFAKEHDEIIVYKRSGEVLNLRPVAVDVVNASRESLVIDQKAEFVEIVAGSDLILREPEEGRQLYVFTTCSYQTNNSRTLVFCE